MDQLEAQVRSAVRAFWRTRRQQEGRQAAGPTRDRGSRAAVTGGKQMDGFVQLMRRLLIDAGVEERSVATGSRIELPGWFRAEKKWDLVICTDQDLRAALEFKSQIGPSFGNNFNNRTE